MKTLWVIALIINGVSYFGSEQYPSEEACKKAASLAVGIKHSCIAIYQGKSEAPAFKCQDGYGDIFCPFRDMGGI